MRNAEPVTTDIILVGGGHAHVHVLMSFAMRREPGVRLTLVARELETPYSGMLPGVIAGLYTRPQAHIDLMKLATATGARLVHAEAIGLDRAQKRVLLRDRAPLGYDIVSLDVGVTPSLDGIAGAAEHAIAVKPIGLFLHKLDGLLDRVRGPDGPRRIAVLGGGAGGVELLLSVRTRLLKEAGALEFSLITDRELLAPHNPRVRSAFRRALQEKGIAVHERARAVVVDHGGIETQDGRRIAADQVLLATQAAAPGWLSETGLALDAAGFVAVGSTLQSLSDPDIFAAGDCAALGTPREKAGVYAVRAGPPLAENLRLRATGGACRPWRPQRRHLALISTGERYAVASRGALKAEGAWLWTVKDRIDRRWMRRYQDTDRIAARMSTLQHPAVSRQISPDEMRCGGCAAKIGPGPLSRALKRLGAAPASDVIIGLEAPDDAAVVAVPGDGRLVLTVDFFRAFISDPYLLGEIAANHALNDVFAMGGTPRYALATAVIPLGSSAKVEEDLYQVLAGARACFDRERVALVGGHSSEGSELAIGFSITGEIPPGPILRKGGLKAGDSLVLTRPLGTGILFAAAMRSKATARSVGDALAQMRASNRAAAEILTAHGATGMTDVSGFGLAGHLGEMLSASGAAAVLDPAALPLYDDILELARAGFSSTLLPENLALSNLLDGDVDRALLAILFDPQTAGGFLAGIPERDAESCVRDLRAGGYAGAGIIGAVTGLGMPLQKPRITLSHSRPG